jgi:hypothetical protein
VLVCGVYFKDRDRVERVVRGFLGLQLKMGAYSKDVTGHDGGRGIKY